MKLRVPTRKSILLAAALLVGAAPRAEAQIIINLPSQTWDCIIMCAPGAIAAGLLNPQWGIDVMAGCMEGCQYDGPT
jgi:hypothetical protein